MATWLVLLLLWLALSAVFVGGWLLGHGRGYRKCRETEVWAVHVERYRQGWLAGADWAQRQNGYADAYKDGWGDGYQRAVGLNTLIADAERVAAEAWGHEGG